MRILDPERIKFIKLKAGTLNITLEDKEVFKSVHCIPMFPFSDQDNFISVAYRKGDEFGEIGIIRHLKKLPLPQQNLVREDMRFRYFIPEIVDIKKVKDIGGLLEWDVITDRGERIFYLKDRRENITIKNDGRLIITDIENCIYKITHYNKLSIKARIQLQDILIEGTKSSRR